MTTFFIIFLHLLILFLFIYLNRFGFFNFLLKEKNNQSHGVNNNELPKAGGVLIVGFLLINPDFYNQEFIYILFILIITLIGILGDLRKEFRYVFRLIVLVISLLIFLLLNNEYIISQFQINTIQIFLFSNFYLSLFFTLACMSVYLVGMNFTDGINGNVFGYSLFVILSIFLIYTEYKLDIIHLITIPIFIYFIFNSILSRFFLGDNGSYLIGFIFATSFIILNNNISESATLKIGLLALYPAFEVLFSIFRKLIMKKSPFKPDNLHLHSLLFNNVNKYSLLSQNINHIISSSIIFLILHLPTFIFIKLIDNTKIIASYYLIFCTVYLIMYLLNLKVLRKI